MHRPALLNATEPSATADVDMLCRFFFFCVGIFLICKNSLGSIRPLTKLVFTNTSIMWNKIGMIELVESAALSWLDCIWIVWPNKGALSFPVLFYKGLAENWEKAANLQTGMSTQTGKHLLFRTCRGVTEVSRSCTCWTLWTFKGQLISFQGSFGGLIINRVVLWLIVTVHKDFGTGRFHIWMSGL